MTDSWRRPATTSEIAFAVDANAAHPPFEQLKSQILQRIDAGELIVGMRLPAVRQLATDLGIAPNTVARAYRELESTGVVTTNRRNGTVVSAAPAAAPNPGRTTPSWPTRPATSSPRACSAARCS